MRNTFWAQVNGNCKMLPLSLKHEFAPSVGCGCRSRGEPVHDPNSLCFTPFVPLRAQGPLVEQHPRENGSCNPAPRNVAPRWPKEALKWKYPCFLLPHQQSPGTAPPAAGPATPHESPLFPSAFCSPPAFVCAEPTLRRDAQEDALPSPHPQTGLPSLFLPFSSLFPLLGLIQSPTKLGFTGESPQHHRNSQFI